MRFLILAYCVASTFAFGRFDRLRSSLSPLRQPIMINPDEMGPFVSAPTSSSRLSKLQNAVSQHEASIYDEYPSFDGRDLSGANLNLLRFGRESMDESFDLPQDNLPKGHKKYIHPLGSLATVKFVPKDNTGGYTGLFQGADACLARLSLAANPKAQGFVPGMALKCYRDGDSPSGNIISMYSLDGQKDNYNFFENVFTNIVAKPESIALKVIAKTIFERASHCPVWISPEQFGTAGNDGVPVSDPKHPVQIYFVPADVKFSADSGKEFRDDLASIPVGSRIWTVEASDFVGGTIVSIGEIVTTGKFAASSYSDDVLFFQHTRGENDGC